MPCEPAERPKWRLLAPMILGACLVGRTQAAVVAVANRSLEPVRFVALVDDQAPRAVKLLPGDATSFSASRAVRLRSRPGDDTGEISLDPDAAYSVTHGAEGSGLAVEKLSFRESRVGAWPEQPPAIVLPDAGTITVKILVDDDEVRRRAVWEPAIRQRIDNASAILEAHAGLRLRVVAVGQWHSDNAEIDFNRSLAEFERETRPHPAMVAIGFSSQYRITKGRTHMGGTRGPLHSHILIKERAQNIMETERLELLVHELGHFLGATHSSEESSIMRPLLGQGRQRSAGARIQFDAANTLLIALLGEEIRQRRVRELTDVTPATRRRMGEIYAALSSKLADDPSASHYLKLLAVAGPKGLVEDAREVLQHVVRVAEITHRVRGEAPAGSNGQTAPSDKLLEMYVQQAAVAAMRVRSENGPRAMLLALGVALDDVGGLRKLPLASSVIPHLEGLQEQRRRIEVLGAPTMHGREDLAKHFFVSAHLVALAGTPAARAAGVLKEMSDADGGSGYSFADMAANRAGIAFAGAVINGHVSLEHLAGDFTVDAYLPDVSGLEEGLDAEQFKEKFGAPGDPRYAAELARIDARIQALPAYQLPQAAPAGNAAR